MKDRLTERLESPRAGACLCAEHRGDSLTASMFSDDLTGSSDPSSSCPTPGLSERSDPCNHRQLILKIGFVGKLTFLTTHYARSSLRMIAIDCISKETLEYGF